MPDYCEHGLLRDGLRHECGKCAGSAHETRHRLRTLLGLSNQDLNEHTAKLEADARALWSYRVIRAAAGLSARPARDALFAMVQLDERLMLNRAAAIFPELPESVRQELGPDPDTQRGGR